MTKTTTAKPDDNNVPETLERSIGTNEPAVPKNALVHGVYSQETVLPWESEKEFNEQHSSFREDFNPQGSYEEDLVGLITLLQWQKRRLFRGQKMAFLTDPMAKEWTEAGKDGWQGIERYVGEKCEAMRSRVGAETAELESSDPSNTFPPIVNTALRTVAELKKKHGQEDSTIGPAAVLKRFNRPSDLDRFLKTLGSLEAQIDKALARLIHVKEYKLRYGKATISQ